MTRNIYYTVKIVQSCDIEVIVIRFIVAQK